MCVAVLLFGCGKAAYESGNVTSEPIEAAETQEIEGAVASLLMDIAPVADDTAYAYQSIG